MSGQMVAPQVPSVTQLPQNAIHYCGAPPVPPPIPPSPVMPRPFEDCTIMACIVASAQQLEAAFDALPVCVGSLGLFTPSTHFAWVYTPSAHLTLCLPMLQFPLLCPLIATTALRYQGVRYGQLTRANLPLQRDEVDSVCFAHTTGQQEIWRRSRSCERLLHHFIK